MSHIRLNLNNRSLIQLRNLWKQLWRHEAHKLIKPALLKKSIIYKIEDNNGRGLTARQKKKLAHLVKRFRDNPEKFDNQHSSHHFGSRLVRIYKGRRYDISILENGFEFDGKIYKSLSEVYKSISN